MSQTEVLLMYNCTNMIKYLGIYSFAWYVYIKYSILTAYLHIQVYDIYNITCIMNGTYTENIQQSFQLNNQNIEQQLNIIYRVQYRNIINITYITYKLIIQHVQLCTEKKSVIVSITISYCNKCLWT